MSEGFSLPLSFHCYAMKESCPPPSADPGPGWLSMRGVLPSEAAKIQAQISNLQVHQPQGQRDAMSEGRSFPLSFHCYAMKESCPPPSADPRPEWLSMQGVLPSEVAKIQAQISNLEVHQVQGRELPHVLGLAPSLVCFLSRLGSDVFCWCRCFDSYFELAVPLIQCPP